MDCHHEDPSSLNRNCIVYPSQTDLDSQAMVLNLSFIYEHYDGFNRYLLPTNSTMDDAYYARQYGDLWPLDVNTSTPPPAYAVEPELISSKPLLRATGSRRVPEPQEKRHEITYNCQDCAFTARNRYRYNAHRRLHNEDSSSFYCRICGKGFNRPMDTKRHVKSVSLHWW